jgi:hypothetical protein
VTEVVERLPSKCKGPELKLQYHKKKKKKKQRKDRNIIHSPDMGAASTSDNRCMHECSSIEVLW